MNRSAWEDHDWELIRTEPQSPAMLVALDEVITDQVASGDRAPTLRIWEWGAPAVVIGRFQSLGNEVDSDAARRHGITVVRRISGGGAMFTEPGNTITWSISAPVSMVADMSFQQSYEMLDAWVLKALGDLGINAWYEPLNDIASPVGKIAGAAQARRGKAVLHHAMMAYNMDAAKMLEVLRIGREKLSDKGTKSAAKRVDPLRSQTGMSRDAIVDSMTASFRDRYGLADGRLSDQDLEHAQQLVDDKFATDAWTRTVP